MKDPHGGNFDLYLINVDGTGLEQVTFSTTFDGFPMFSPDGKKLVFASNRHSMKGRTRTCLSRTSSGSSTTGPGATAHGSLKPQSRDSSLCMGVTRSDSALREPCPSPLARAADCYLTIVSLTAVSAPSNTTTGVAAGRSF